MSWRNDPSINAWTRQNGLLTAEDMTRWRIKIASDPTIHMFGIQCEDCLGSSYGNVGTCGLTGISLLHGHAEFSLLIKPELHRKGFGRAALIELLKYGFKNLRLNRIWGETFQGNPAFKLFLSLGMMDEGVTRESYFKNGEYIDANIVSILRKEAEAQAWWT